MSKPSLQYHPSLEGSDSISEALRPSLFQTKDAFIKRIAPTATAAIYFGSFSLAPQDTSLSRQALFKLSFLHRHFLQPGGLRITVEKHTAILTGTVTSPTLCTLAKILASQIEGIREVRDMTDGHDTTANAGGEVSTREAIQFLFATDQTLRSGIQVGIRKGSISLEGEVRTAAQKTWAELLAAAAGGEVDSKLRISGFTPPPLTPSNEPPQVDDESLQAFVLFRLQLVRETKNVNVKVKAVRGVVSLYGKVATEALRQRAENLTRSTLGVRELRSQLSIAS